MKFSFLHVLPSVYKFVHHDICIICDVDEERLHIPNKERAVASYVHRLRKIDECTPRQELHIYR